MRTKDVLQYVHLLCRYMVKKAEKLLDEPIVLWVEVICIFIVILPETIQSHLLFVLNRRSSNIGFHKGPKIIGTQMYDDIIVTALLSYVYVT